MDRKNYFRQYYVTHKEHMKLITARWKANHSEEWATAQRQSLGNKKQKLKSEILLRYGNGKCACVKCGFDNILALSIDHINGNGAEHRKSNPKVHGGHLFYSWLKKGNYPEGYQTLCMNCQWIKKWENNEFRKKL